MRKRVVAKGNIHRSDHLRTLVTDTLPGDVPIVVSNDGFYRNMKSYASAHDHPDEFVRRLLSPSKSIRYTIPYRYSISRPDNSPRLMSLMHPASQLAVTEFYRQNDHLICYYARKSKASIRSPKKIGSLFFVRGARSEKNRLKSSGIDTVEIETSVSNPASYFSYRGYRRAFEFFNSAEYMRLEKAYQTMALADISKCFHSIYTHTMFWAIADRETAKDNTSAHTFSNEFDRLMQSSNFNETNGICIGAEVSRIFAELILSEVDSRIIENLKNKGKIWKRDYEYRRYVDDYYVFSSNLSVNDEVISSISEELSRFNLHLNTQKTEIFQRPFITKKSRMIVDANFVLDQFFNGFIKTPFKTTEGYVYPTRIWHSNAALRAFLDGIKASCYDNESGYGEVANYVIGAIATRIRSLVNGYDKAITDGDASADDYVSAIGLLLEASFFFYSVSPSVASSLRVAQSSIEAFNFFVQKIPDRKAFISEQIVRWTHQFMRSFDQRIESSDERCVSLAVINILLVLGEMEDTQALVEKVIADFCESVGKFGYFEIVSMLFCVRNHSMFAPIKANLFDRAKALIRGSRDLRIDAEAAMLALDVLACPYVTMDDRKSLLNEMRSMVNLPVLSNADALSAVQAFESAPWFVKWGDANLLHMIRKKELSSVY